MERLVYGEPEWETMQEEDVAALIGEEEMRAPAPAVREPEGNPWTGVRSGI